MPNLIAGLLLSVALLGAAFMSCRLVRTLVRLGKLPPDWEIQVLVTALIMAVSLVAVVEVTSLLALISTPGLFCAWLFPIAALHLGIGKLQAQFDSTEITEPPSSWRSLRQTDWTTEQKLLLFGTILTMLCLLAIAVLTPPTSWDSMTYHLPRILNWIQNGSVAHFATSDTRQVESGPFAAFAVMHLFLITNSDQIVNLVQWGAMALSLTGVSWLTGQAFLFLQPSASPAAIRTAKIWSSALGVSMPIGIVQSITTQTDYVVAFWFISMAVFGILLVRQPGNILVAICFGGSLALGLITKATMAVTSALLAATLFALAWKRITGPRPRLHLIGAVAISGTLLVTPHFSRNLLVFGSPLGSDYMYSIMSTERHSPAVWLSNFLRNVSLHAASGIPPVTKTVNAVLHGAHAISGLDENDRATTFHTSTFKYLQGFPLSDNSAGNFWHGLLILLGTGVLFVFFPAARKVIASVFLIVLATFIFQSAYVRWTEWNARFHLPLFLLLLPLPAVAFGAHLPKIPKVILALGLGVLAFCSTFYNKSRPILGGSDFVFQEREQQYFLEVPFLYEPAVQVANNITASSSTKIGLRMYKNFFHFLDEMEYPFWIMLKNRGFTGEIHNIGVTNETASLSNSVAIQALISSGQGPASDVLHKLPYKLSYPPIDVYWSEPASRWAELSQVDLAGSQRVLARENDGIEFRNDAAIISARVPRQGVLKYQGAFVQDGSVVHTPTVLSIKSYSGFVVASRSTNAVHEVEIPLPPGQTAIQLGAQVPGYSNAAFALDFWTWLPTDQPLPYVYVSKILAPTNAPTRETNVLTVATGSTRTVQVVSGGDGLIELQFHIETPSSNSLELSGEAFSTNVSLASGSRSLRVPITRGTNEFRITNPATNMAAPIILNRIEARFREFVD